MNLARVRALRLELREARTVALLAGWSSRRKHRRAYAAELRRLLAEIDEQLADVEREGWDA